VATISSAGLATGVALGSTNISATENGVASTPFVLTVTGAVLQSIVVTPRNPSILKGSTQQFTATGTFSDGSAQDVTGFVTWVSSDPTIASVNPTTGLTTAVKGGGATITAAQNEVSSSTTLTINNLVPSVTSLSPNVLPIGAAQTLTINGSNFDNNSTVTYNGVPHVATFVSANQLTVQLNSVDVAMPGLFPVVVTNPIPGGGSSTAIISVAGLIVVPSVLEFGLVPDGSISAFQTGTLLAVGTDLTVNSLTVSNNVFSVTGSSSPLQFPIQLGAGNSLQFAVTFNPLLDSPGHMSGSVTFKSNVNSATQTLSGTGTSIVQLTWQPSPTPNVYYKVYRCGNTSPLIADATCLSNPRDDSDYIYIASVGFGILTYTDLAAPSGKYYYLVTAADTNGEESDKSSASNPAVVP